MTSLAANDNGASEFSDCDPQDWLERIEAHVDGLVRHLGDDGTIETLQKRDIIVALVETALGLTSDVFVPSYF